MGESHSLSDLPLCEILDEDKIELFTFLELNFPKLNKSICKPKKDLISVDESSTKVDTPKVEK